MEKRPVTIYLSPHLHTALKHAAADQGSSMSDLVNAAVEASLRGEIADPAAVRSIGATPVRDEFPSAMALLLAPVMDALAEQTAAIRQIEGLVESKAEGAGSDTVTPQAGRVAGAASEILGYLSHAGDAGISFRGLRSAMSRKEVSTAAMEAAIAALREAGVIIRKGKNWILVHRPQK